MVGAGASAVGAYFNYKGAEKGEPVIVTPPIEDYSKELQAVAAAEVKSLNGPCSWDTVIVANCSAVKRLVNYGSLRQQIRAAREKDLRLRLGRGRDRTLRRSDSEAAGAISCGAAAR